MDVKLEQIVAVVVRCFLLYLMLVVGFQYVMLIGTFISQSFPPESAFFLLASVAIYAVLIVAMYKAPTIARKIIPNADTTVVKNVHFAAADGSDLSACYRYLAGGG